MAKHKNNNVNVENDESEPTDLQKLDLIAFCCDQQIARAKDLLEELVKVLHGAGHIQQSFNVLLPSPEED